LSKSKIVVGVIIIAFFLYLNHSKCVSVMPHTGYFWAGYLLTPT